ncbi:MULTISPECIES: hypothetical protein [Acinetobacter]|uniref:DUF2783 domain-containing protein n=1 Tax=Acinetobacter piscicola TaxID=2006115 RepID=A0A4Q4H3M7_9GAMM|nr:MULTISPECIES: hypothetical protein [Acinetobacter]MDM1757707.1 hypothetical protein [Acinetobacter sp. 256-1]MDM1762134.1 hypothetical protein [Acinetobacter sp. 251-1]QOW47679.1 hypothetical protein G0028_18370 [Acinetobacter piscicola]RYL29684.1 hypothetical protein EWP19_02595 [Acinetobacter piscicola]
MSISIEHLEKVYDHLAETIDAVPLEKRELFLVKLALLSANQIQDSAIFQQLIHQAKQFED